VLRLGITAWIAGGVDISKELKTLLKISTWVYSLKPQPCHKMNKFNKNEKFTGKCLISNYWFSSK
jgi:hypothetical protein